ncbi:ABC transporter ATP-binding protein, partial [uncultured Corynebacterium sp.]
SGGERARVAFARVLAQNTPVILLDEPTAALDIRHQEQLLGSVKALAREAGVAVLVVLHDLNAAAAYCDHVVCLSCGGLAAQGRVDEVFTGRTLSQVYDWPISVDGLRVHPQRATPAINPLFSHHLEDFHV